MVDVITSIEINRPLQEVAAYVFNPDNAPEWYVNIESAVWKTAKPLSIGSKVDFVAHFMGKRLSYTYEFTELSSNKVVMKTAEGPFPMETTYLLEKIDENKTKMILRNQGEPTGFIKIFKPFLSWMMKRANNKDLKNLKTILEIKFSET